MQRIVWNQKELDLVAQCEFFKLDSCGMEHFLTLINLKHEIYLFKSETNGFLQGI